QKHGAPPSNAAVERTAPAAPLDNDGASWRNAGRVGDGDRSDPATRLKPRGGRPSTNAPASPQAFPASPPDVVSTQARSEAAVPRQQPGAVAEPEAAEPARPPVDAASRRSTAGARLEGADARSAKDGQPLPFRTAPARAASPSPQTPAPAMPASPAAPRSASGELRESAADIVRKADPQAASAAATADQADATLSRNIVSGAKDAPVRPADEWIRLIQ